MALSVRTRAGTPPDPIIYISHDLHDPAPRPHTCTRNAARGGAFYSAPAVARIERSERVRTLREDCHVLPRVRGAKHGHGACLGYDRRGSPPWLPAGVTFGLPRRHTQRSGRCPNSRLLAGQRRRQRQPTPTCGTATSPTAIVHHRPPTTPHKAGPPVL